MMVGKEKLYIHAFICQDCDCMFTINRFGEESSERLGTIDYMPVCPLPDCNSKNVYMDDVFEDDVNEP